jgi:dUTP pyrophosphatase
MLNIEYIRTRSDAVIPSRAHPSDIGLDLVCVSEAKRINNNTILYETGISVSPPDGYYTEILPRSSMSKSGWMLANSVGTIDPSYTGSLKVALIRVNPEAPEPILPFCLCQLVLRRAFYGNMLEVGELGETSRGEGGFGSTGDRASVNQPPNLERQLSTNLDSTQYKQKGKLWAP